MAMRRVEDEDSFDYAQGKLDEDEDDPLHCRLPPADCRLWLRPKAVVWL